MEKPTSIFPRRSLVSLPISSHMVSPTHTAAKRSRGNIVYGPRTTPRSLECHLQQDPVPPADRHSRTQLAVSPKNRTSPQTRLQGPPRSPLSCPSNTACTELITPQPTVGMPAPLQAQGLRRSRQLRAGLLWDEPPEPSLGHLPKCMPHLAAIRFMKLKYKRKKKEELLASAFAKFQSDSQHQLDRHGSNLP